MQWQFDSAPVWPKPIDNQADKERIAEQLAQRAEDGDVIGIGSGSTSFLALLALAKRVHGENLNILCVPTSHEIEGYCAQLGLPLTSLVSVAPDWCFDGADEIDAGKNMIKGRGGAFVREQLVFASAAKRVILADPTKQVERLGTVHPVPLGVVPEAINLVRRQCNELVGSEPVVRPAGGKDGGVINEEGLIVMDLPIEGSLPVAELEKTLLTIPGISASGLFVGYDYDLIT